MQRGTTVASTNKTTAPVEATTTNSVATLDWMPPTENSDGSVLINLAGYTPDPPANRFPPL